jgi:hypothetical protein
MASRAVGLRGVARGFVELAMLRSGHDLKIGDVVVLFVLIAMVDIHRKIDEQSSFVCHQAVFRDMAATIGKGMPGEQEAHVSVGESSPRSFARHLGHERIAVLQPTLVMHPAPTAVERSAFAAFDRAGTLRHLGSFHQGSGMARAATTAPGPFILAHGYDGHVP